MKFFDTEVLAMFAGFVEGPRRRYIRFYPVRAKMPLWYQATTFGFELVEDHTYDELEKAYHEQKQQTSQEEGNSATVHPASSKGAEGATKH
jgi:hypothetical protein